MPNRERISAEQFTEWEKALTPYAIAVDEFAREKGLQFLPPLQDKMVLQEPTILPVSSRALNSFFHNIHHNLPHMQNFVMLQP